jgi:hypothetical protein
VAGVDLLLKMADYDAQPGREPPEPPDLSAAQRESDEVDLSAGLRGVAGIVAGAQAVIDLLRDVAEFAARAIPGVDGAGVALIDPRQGLPSVQTWAATAVLVQEIDAVQYGELHEGPCITSMQTGRPTVSGSLGCDSRWPQFGGRVARMRVHSALSLPLVVGDQVIGVINAYAKDRDAFGEHAVHLGSQFAQTAAVAVYNAQLAGVGQPCGDRPGDRHHPQPVGRQRSGGVRAARKAQSNREREVVRGRGAAGRGGGAARECAACSVVSWDIAAA